ncbi:hypothetical protein MMC14_000234 [Varicellaria rhodocarpa]|nr:hypothetical protein [Varicellaria rhodocarpa]
MGPWTPQDAEDQAFFITYNGNVVQTILYWARLAFLTPVTGFKAFKPANTLRPFFDEEAARGPLDTFNRW